MITMHATDFTSPSDARFMMSLLTQGPRPALLVLCRDGRPEPIVASLMAWCAAPVHLCRLPGPLDLPLARKGTVLLSDVAAMTLPQQIELHDWLNAGRDAVQVVSVTSAPLWPLVEQGKFLEGLFYRLNVVTLEAARDRFDA